MVKGHLEYYVVYQTQFAMKQYYFSMIADISGFPPCNQL